MLFKKSCVINAKIHILKQHIKLTEDITNYQRMKRTVSIQTEHTDNTIKREPSRAKLTPYRSQWGFNLQSYRTTSIPNK